MATLKYIAGADLMTITLSSAYTAGSGAMSLTAGHGARLPAAGDFWLRTTTGDYRCFKVTARSTDDLTVTAAQDGTSDGNLDAGAELKWVLGVAAFDQFRADLVVTGADGSKAAEKAGKLYLPSDGVYLRRDTGAAWQSWGPLVPCTEPVLADFAWVNQGTATGVSTYGGIHMSAVANASHDLKILKKAAPTVPYTVTVAIIPNLMPVDYANLGLTFRRASNGYLHSFCVQHIETEWNLVCDEYTGPADYAGNYVRVPLKHLPRILWLRIADNNTNRICSFSLDGLTFHTIYTIGRTDFLGAAANEVGVYVNAVSAGYGISGHFIHWLET